MAESFRKYIYIPLPLILKQVMATKKKKAGDSEGIIKYRYFNATA